MWLYLLDSYETADISQTTDKSLQTRVDSKFVIPVALLPSLLDGLQDDYICQVINGLRISRYESNYFDTIDYKSYHDTRIKKPTRLKIRRRLYHNGNLSFLEIKKKVKGHRTVKDRIVCSEAFKTSDQDFFLRQYGLLSEQLHPVMDVFYDRFTLISKNDTERVTIDTDIVFGMGGRKKSMKNLAIIEIKQDKLSTHSIFYKKLLSFDVRKLSVSKYCVGLGLLKEGINTRGFNKKLEKVKMLINS